MRITRKYYADRTPSSRAVATLGRGERVLQVDGCGDGPAIDDARRQMVRDLRDYLRGHDEILSIQVVAAAQYGGFTVEQYDRSDLV